MGIHFYQTLELKGMVNKLDDACLHLGSRRRWEWEGSCTSPLDIGDVQFPVLCGLFMGTVHFNI